MVFFGNLRQTNRILYSGSQFKKDDPRLKENYRPITVQVTVNKVFEQLLSKQLSHSFEGRFSDKLNCIQEKK